MGWAGCVEEATREFPLPVQRLAPDAGADADQGSGEPRANETGGGEGDAGADADAALDVTRGADAGDGDRDSGRPDAPESHDAGADVDLGDGSDGGETPLESLRVVVISDLNDGYGATTYGAPVWSAIDRVLELEPDLVISTGDMVAGQQAGLDYRAMWDGFHEAVSDPLADAGIPFAVTPGNHDASGYSGFSEERAIFVDEWLARRPDVAFLDDSEYPMRYSFTMGPVLFVSLDDTIVGPMRTEELEWLEDQLDDGLLYPVKIVYGHIPLYPLAQGREDEVRRDFELEDLLVAYDVTAFISGHHHAYYPGRRGDLRLVGMACLGSGPRKLIDDDVTSPRSIVQLELSELGIESLEAFAGTDFTDVIERSSLPSSVGAAPMTVWRDDVEPSSP